MSADTGRVKLRYRPWRKKPRLRKRSTLVRKPVRRVEQVGPDSHDGSELERMLAGTKPLAMFTEIVPFDGGIIPEYKFAAHVAAGRMVRREVIKRVSSRLRLPSRARQRTVFYALPGQEWRIDGMLLIEEVYADHPYWDFDLERLIGRLLGYTPRSTEAFLAGLRLGRK